MNMPTHRDESDVPADEWNVQERALRAERLGLAAAGDDDRLHEYRQVARALRSPLPDPLPADFAEHVARRAGASRVSMRDGFERTAGMVLMLLLLATGAGYGAASSGAWWQALVAWIPPHALASPWLPGLAACTGLTALLGMLSVPRRHPRR